MIPASWLPLATGARITQPRSHLLEHPCTRTERAAIDSFNLNRFSKRTHCKSKGVFAILKSSAKKNHVLSVRVLHPQSGRQLLLTPAGLAGDDGLVPDLVGPQLGEEAPALLVVDRRLLRGN